MMSTSKMRLLYLLEQRKYTFHAAVTRTSINHCVICYKIALHIFLTHFCMYCEDAFCLLRYGEALKDR